MTEIFRERLAASAAGAPELVLLHGWGSDSNIWRPLIPQLRRHFHLTLIDLPLHSDGPLAELLPLLPARAIYLGWSLGGMLATRLAAQHPERVQALITVASNACFVGRDSWPVAMAAEQFQDFVQLAERAPAKAARRFAALQCLGDERASAVKKMLAAIAVKAWPAEQLQRGLGWLRDWDNRQALQAVRCPAVHILAEADALVPASAAEQLEQLGLRSVVMSGCGHLPFLSRPEQFIEHCLRFLKQHGLLAVPGAGEDELVEGQRSFKREVARSFSRAAACYDGLAHLQQQVGERLLHKLPPAAGGRVMDLGCGTGFILPALRAHTGAESLLAMDLAEGMLNHARERGAVPATYLCGDAEDLPLADASLELVYSSFSLQWCKNLSALYAELARVLRPGGRAFITTLGPQTLPELKAAWQQVDSFVHVNDFAPREQLETAIAHAELELVAFEERCEVLHYQKLSELTRELKGIGAHNVNTGRRSGLTGPAQLRRLQEAYEAFRDAQGRLSASYQVWYLQLRRPHGQ